MSVLQLRLVAFCSSFAEVGLSFSTHRPRGPLQGDSLTGAGSNWKGNHSEPKYLRKLLPSADSTQVPARISGYRRKPRQCLFSGDLSVLTFSWEILAEDNVDASASEAVKPICQGPTSPLDSEIKGKVLGEKDPRGHDNSSHSVSCTRIQDFY